MINLNMDNSDPDIFGGSSDLLELISLEKERIDAIEKYVQFQLGIMRDQLDLFYRRVIQMDEASKSGSQAEKITPPLNFLDDVDDEREKETLRTLLNYEHKEARAEDLAPLLGKHRSTISQYLNRLHDIGKVSKKRVGHEVYYSILVTQEEIQRNKLKRKSLKKLNR